MNYPNGEKVLIGDKVRLGSDNDGVVVCSIDDGAYSAAYPESHWSYLKVGVIVNFKRMGLVHMDSPEDDLQLVERAG